MDYKQFDILKKRLDTYEKQERPYSIELFVKFEGYEMQEFSPPLSDIATIDEQFREALRYKPDKIIFYEYNKANPHNKTKRVSPVGETIISLNNPAANHPNNQAASLQGLAGEVEGERLTMDAMVERIKQQNEKIKEKDQEIEELHGELNEIEANSEGEEGLAGVLKGISLDQITQLAGTLMPLLKGGQAPQSPQLSGSEQKQNELPQPIQNVVSYLQTLETKEFDKIYEVFQFMSASEDNMNQVYNFVTSLNEKNQQ